MKILCKITLISMLILLGNISKTMGADTSFPFQPGEKLTYSLKWAFITAGEAVLEVLPPTNFQGNKALHFQARARTNSFVDTIYKVRDQIDSFADERMTHSLHYHKKEKEGSHEGEVTISFDWQQGKAQYKQVKDAKEPELKIKDPITISPITFDPLSIFYSFRLQHLAIGRTLYGYLTDGKKSVLGRANVLAREIVTVKAGKFDTFLVEPDLGKIGGVFKKSENAKLQIWVTADKYHIPVKIKSKVAVGYFTIELKDLQGVFGK